MKAVKEVNDLYLYYERMREGLGNDFYQNFEKDIRKYLSIHNSMVLSIIKNRYAI
jgi:hypothetical protein